MQKIITTALFAVTAVAALTACEVEDTGGGSAADRNAEASSSYTTAQNNAIDSAKSYLKMGNGFSRSGLIQQLSSKAGEGYKRKDQPMGPSVKGLVSRFWSWVSGSPGSPAG